MYVDHGGSLDLFHLKTWLNNIHQKPFVVLDYANSEIGVIQNVKQIIDLVHSHNGTVYLDCTGSISQIPLDVQVLNVDMAGFSAHKLGGLKGCGVLYKKPDITLEPLVFGAQEQGLYGGTENVLGIVSLGEAVKQHDYASVSCKNRDYVYRYIVQYIPDAYLIGNRVNRLPYNLYLCFKYVDGESLMTLMDLNGIQISTGSACNERNLSVSPTLSAIGIDQQDLHSCVRMTFHGKETREELDYVCETLKRCVESLRDLN